MTDGSCGRDGVVKSLVEELLGPAPGGDELDCTQPIRFESWEEARRTWQEKGSGEEILQKDRPTKRYGLGVLYPFGSLPQEERLDETGDASPGFVAQLPAEDPEAARQGPDNSLLLKNIGHVQEGLPAHAPEQSPDDIDLSLANTYKPSSMALSFLVDAREGAVLVVEANAGRYVPLDVRVGEQDQTWWVRSPIRLRAEFELGSFLESGRTLVAPARLSSSNTEGIDIRIEAYRRPSGPDPQHQLVTVCLVNRAAGGSWQDEKCLFQAGFKAEVLAGDTPARIMRYPAAPMRDLDDEEFSIALLYREAATFAVGHGCAADWETSAGTSDCSSVKATCLPLFETPSVTPEIPGCPGISMAMLAGMDASEAQARGELDALVAKYEDWINSLEREAPSLESEFHRVARDHVSNCRKAAARMRQGIEFLERDREVAKAFKLANLAILLQQRQSVREPRLASYDPGSKRFVFSRAYVNPDEREPTSGSGIWRPFQIAFMLMCLESAALAESTDRETVELLWFPTGGGKTEAYLGLAAFVLFLRRLRNSEDTGTGVLMRYTLRLLTTQQFQRAARLICAMERIRLKHQGDLGESPFSIGMWVGGTSTPNTRSDALSTLRALQKGDRNTPNRFVLDRCPWCGAQVGPIERRPRSGASAPRLLGYVAKEGTVRFECPDPSCPFSAPAFIPVYVIDEDIYAVRPSMVIGTVDKFAMLAWRPEARSLFGVGKAGERETSPPQLIIQDELHMISGPLGSVVGLYETVVEELCTDRKAGVVRKPKIVCSTATIRRYGDQVRALYARCTTALFPPPGLRASDSFFSRYARDASGCLMPGRLYVGVNTPGLGSMQTTEVRSLTALLQAPMRLEEKDRDPWWTLLVFFNSLRELGTSLSLMQSDIPDYQKVIMYRTPQERRAWRRFDEILELTGRASGEDIPRAISALEIGYPPGPGLRSVDVCLASSILEVGVDIDRLGLIVVVGQPKTTSQYIQVTGRIGRKWWSAPGLVVTLYSASKPRDRSHFEKFRSYHETLYAQVEPTSVTPFSPPALERALHAVIVAYVRQLGDDKQAGSPHPFPAEVVESLRQILLPRVQMVEPLELAAFESIFDRKIQQWRTWKSTKWSGKYSDDDIPILRAAGEYASAEVARLSWATPQSMRTVDAECIAQIAVPPLEGEEDQNAQQS